MYTKEDWKTQAVKVTKMILEEDKESSENPTEEKLHEMMEQAAREICDERDS